MLRDVERIAKQVDTTRATLASRPCEPRHPVCRLAIFAIDNHSHYHYRALVGFYQDDPGASRPMYVCICRGITDSQIRRVVDRGAVSLAQVKRELAVAACCGRCAPMARDIIRAHSQTAAVPVAAIPVPA